MRTVPSTDLVNGLRGQWGGVPPNDCVGGGGQRHDGVVEIVYRLDGVERPRPATSVSLGEGHVLEVPHFDCFVK
jgi:hypothetical protein